MAATFIGKTLSGSLRKKSKKKKSKTGAKILVHVPIKGELASVHHDFNKGYVILFTSESVHLAIGEVSVYEPYLTNNDPVQEVIEYLDTSYDSAGDALR